jgi:predicted nucleic acid-binding protein
MATRDADPIFIDTNILMFATDPGSAFHASAARALEEAAASADLYVNCQVLREYLAAGTRSAPGQLDDLLKNIDSFRNSFHVLDESEACLERLLQLARNVRFGGKQVHDANIVACMLENGISRLLTHNVEDFKRFKDMIDISSLE